MWRILVKAVETKVDTAIDNVKCISLLHNIIIDFEDYCCLHSRLSQHDFLIPAAHTSDQEAADKQAWSLLPARASVLHARSLLAATQDIPIYIHVYVRSSEWAGYARARWSLASRT